MAERQKITNGSHLGAEATPVAAKPWTPHVALVVGCAFFMVLLDASVITTSLPTMAKSFGVSSVDLSLGLSVYWLALALFAPLSAWLADLMGARRLFSMALVVFVVASWLCGMVDDIWAFAAARTLQGAAGAFMVPVGRLVVLHTTPKSDLVRAMATIALPALIAPVIGPLLGGAITTYWSWPWIFYLNLPLGLIVWCLAQRWIPETLPSEKRPLDVWGFVLTASALVGILYGLDWVARQPEQFLGALSLIVMGVFIAFLAVRHLGRSQQPLFSLAVTQVPTYAVSNLWVGTALRTGINSTPFLLPLFFQEVMQLSPIKAGTYVLVYFAGNLGMKTSTSVLLRWLGFRQALFFNGLLCGTSIVACGWLNYLSHDALIMPLLFLAGLSRSLQYAALNSLAFADVHPSQRASGTTLGFMLQQISLVFGVACSVWILNVAATWGGLSVFEWAFCLMGTLVIMASFGFLGLVQTAGQEVSGHKAACQH